MVKKSKKPRVFDLKGKKRDLSAKGRGPCPHCKDIYQGDSELKEHMDKCKMKVINYQIYLNLIPDFLYTLSW